MKPKETPGLTRRQCMLAALAGPQAAGDLLEPIATLPIPPMDVNEGKAIILWLNYSYQLIDAAENTTRELAEAIERYPDMPADERFDFARRIAKIVPFGQKERAALSALTKDLTGIRNLNAVEPFLEAMKETSLGQARFWSGRDVARHAANIQEVAQMSAEMQQRIIDLLFRTQHIHCQIVNTMAAKVPALQRDVERLRVNPDAPPPHTIRYFVDMAAARKAGGYPNGSKSESVRHLKTGDHPHSGEWSTRIDAPRSDAPFPSSR